jgi:hypothetical protein
MFNPDTPVFSLARHRALVGEAVAAERGRLAAALDVEANTIGGAVGGALRAIAEQLRASQTTVKPSPVTPGTSYRDEDDPPLSVPFEALTPAQRQRRLAQRAEVQRQGAESIAAQLREQEAQIARDREVLQRLRAQAPDVAAEPEDDGLPPLREHSDDADAAALVRRITR